MANTKGQQTILLVDDDNELRSYLKSLLNPIYSVLTAKSGEIALEMLSEIEPDMVITDISMKKVSGLDLLDSIKNNPLKKHIPVIVLTAFTETTYQMESILRGADSFFTKPLNDKVLLAQVNNVFERQASQKLSNTTKNTNNKPREVSESFIETVESIIEKNFQNPNFCIDHILDELSISKSTLDRKLRQNANLNPSGLIRDVRLKNAIKLMKTNKFNIDEIATYVGFNSSSYFIRTFKAKYGLTPREYRQKHKE